MRNDSLLLLLLRGQPALYFITQSHGNLVTGADSAYFLTTSPTTPSPGGGPKPFSASAYACAKRPAGTRASSGRPCSSGRTSASRHRCPAPPGTSSRGLRLAEWGGTARSETPGMPRCQWAAAAPRPVPAALTPPPHRLAGVQATPTRGPRLAAWWALLHDAGPTRRSRAAVVSTRCRPDADQVELTRAAIGVVECERRQDDERQGRVTHGLKHLEARLRGRLASRLIRPRMMHITALTFAPRSFKGTLGSSRR